MTERRARLQSWLDSSLTVVAGTAPLTVEIEDTQSVVGMELAAWRELMKDFDALEARVAALGGPDGP